MKISFRIVIPVVFLALMPGSAFAAVVIDEIMYDLEGGDVGREWIEVVNTGDNTIDLTNWKLNEANTNHGLTLSQGDATIPAGGFVIIADNPGKFLIDYPGFSGTIFDSSFSLSNTGETLVLRDANLADIDVVTYSSDQGGAGDGNSLQKINGAWQGARPTPGSVNISSGTTATGNNSAASPQEISATPATSDTNTTSSSSTGPSFPVDPQIFVSAGERLRTVVVGADIVLSGKVWGLKKEPIDNARMIWNFGDGTTQEGKTIKHTYRYPGTYVVILDASSGYYSASDHITIKAVPADIAISSVGDAQSSFVELHNKSSSEIDLSLWSIRAGNNVFVIPDHTFIASQSKLKFSDDVTKLIFDKSSPPGLYYPNGTLAVVYTPVAASVPVASPPSKQSMLPIKVAASPKQDTVVKSGAVVPNEQALESDTQAAFAAGVPEGTIPLWWWLAGVFFLAVVGSGSVVAVKRNLAVQSAKSEADSYEIIEETGDDKIPF
jgi:hypothetical protein